MSPAAYTTCGRRSGTGVGRGEAVGLGEGDLDVEKLPLATVPLAPGGGGTFALLASWATSVKVTVRKRSVTTSECDRTLVPVLEVDSGVRAFRSIRFGWYCPSLIASGMGNVGR